MVYLYWGDRLLMTFESIGGTDLRAEAVRRVLDHPGVYVPQGTTPERFLYMVERAQIRF